MINGKFIEKFPNSHGIFMPYMISDHSRAVLRIPKGMERRKAFRFSNFITDKEFIPTGDRFENDKVAEQFVKPFQEFLGKKDVITKNLKNAMFDIDDNKAPGPYGYTARFYKSAWSVIGKVKNFLRQEDFLGSKIIINRLKGVLGNLVHESQSAFIAGRQISDNILLAHELFKWYNRKQNARKVAFKIDLQKAYDTISWDFIEVVLKQFGFPKKMVDWIMVCVSTTKFSININGEREGYFIGSSISVIKEALEEFSSYSGLKANMHKSTLFFGGMTSAEHNIILGIIPFAIGKLPVRYLGVPLITKKISSTDCKPLIDKVKNRVLDWRNKALSYSGRLQLISSVLSAMQIYWASVFLLPKNEVNANANSSDGWKEMLRLRDKIRKHVLWKIGDGKDINTWYDNWNIHGPLYADITSREIYDAGLSIETTITDLIVVCRDNCPEGWLDEFPVLHQYGFLRILNNRKDTIVWVNKEGNNKLFSIKNIWKDMEVDDGKVDWYNVIWFNKNIPRHAFVLWMALQGRLSTHDRIAAWKPNDVMQC
ncbi:RNA-directed DNA polymerase, eukaryota, reverse transcriptase zinc-binding domain protein [Tanacetum coccineum]